MNSGNKSTQAVIKETKPNKPLVSIITVCLNSEKYLEQTIQSVLNQTYPNIEYLIIDGGSTDKTLEIIKKYESQIAYWVSEPDKGIYDAMNKGISCSHGQWIGIINSDDWYAPDAVHLIIEAAKEKPESEFFFGNLMIHIIEDGLQVCIQKEGRVEGDGVFLKKSLPHPTCFVTRRIYDQFQFNPEFRIAGDYDWMARLYFKGICFNYINRTLANFRYGGISTRVGYRLMVEHYQIHSDYNRLKAIVTLFYSSIGFFFWFLYDRSPEVVKTRLKAEKKKLQAWRTGIRLHQEQTKRDGINNK